MFQTKPWYLFFWLLVFIFSCSTKGKHSVKRYQPPTMDTTHYLRGTSFGKINYAPLNEISGIVESRRYPGYFWVHNDSGGDPMVYLIDDHAQLAGRARLEGVSNRDWEDLAIAGPTDSTESTLYVADIGDNQGIYGTYYIYSFPEPSLTLQNPKGVVSITNIQTIRFKYPDGARDAETLLSDPWTKDLFIISKRDQNVGIYRLPASNDDIVTLDKLGSIPVTMVVGGDISANGNEILLKTYGTVFYWERKEGEALEDVFQRTLVKLPYKAEPQGESIAFSKKLNGYVTISEKQKQAELPPLFFYRHR